MENQSTNENQSFIHAIRNGYGIDIKTLQFSLRGWGGDCYIAQTRDGKRYFLKVHDDATYMGTAATSRPFYLPLMDQLHNKGILPNIPHPIPTITGTLSLQMGSNELVITNFIDADLVGFGELSESILGKLAELVGILHTCHSQLDFEHPFIEQFQIDFESDLVRSFEAIAAIKSTDSRGKQLLHGVLVPKKTKILHALQHLKELQSQARLINKPKVICHTDLHGGNLMTDELGTLYILDWENAMIAPPEHDLFFFVGQNKFWDVIWPRYSQHFAAASIDCEILSFYFYRRALEDIVGFVLRIMQDDGDENRDQEDIDWLQENLNALEEIEKTILEIRGKLESQNQ